MRRKGWMSRGCEADVDVPGGRATGLGGVLVDGKDAVTLHGNFEMESEAEG
jgi:hypothetical protein